MRSASVEWLLLVGAIVVSTASRAEQPPKIPVAMGAWTGPHAATFKGALRSGMSKECVTTKAAKARVVIDGEISAAEKGFKVRVILKSPKTQDVVESHEYTFAKPKVSAGMSKKMGREVCAMAVRAPE
jgi:hypothetical protein